MHPILTDKGSLALYLAAWVVIGLLLAALVAVPDHFDWLASLALALPMVLLYSFVCLSSWYICRAFPLQATVFPTLLLVYSVAAFLSSSVWILVGKGWAMALNRLWFGEMIETQYAKEVPLIFGVGIILFFLAVAIHYLMITFEASREAERRALELKLLAQEAELKALRAQIDPHFLFNSLNSISAMTTSDPEGARVMCLKLADFLRRSLRFGAQEYIKLDEEISLAMNFLDVERTRFGSRLKVEQHIDEVTKQCLVPPLLLQPLFENALNHGIAHLLEGGTISFQTEWRGSRLSLKLRNPCDPDRPKSRGNGLGLDNVRKRLRTLYGNDARIDIKEDSRYFDVEVLLPARTNSTFN